MGMLKIPEEEILAAGPVVGGPATRPYRIILWRRRLDDCLVVHRQYVDDIRGLDSGDYFDRWQADREVKAAQRWLERVTRELPKDVRCLILDAPKQAAAS